jgi:glycerate 2-kinase
MHILIAPDKFKGSLNAREVADYLRRGIETILPKVTITCTPLADGGEGFMETIIQGTNGQIVFCKAHDPVMHLIDSSYGITEEGTTAIIEIAAISGLGLLSSRERNPLLVNTFGTGELIRHALDKGCRKFIIGIGGSATNDGGMGMARALGVRFLNKDGDELTEGGQLGLLVNIDTTHLDKRIISSEFIVACDVTNPLTGPNGTSYVYGPQKGATEDMIPLLDGYLMHYATVIRQQLNVDIETIPGGGAAGGLGAGMSAFLNAKLENGFKVISEAVKLEKQILLADVIITGEGKLDAQTYQGKTPFGVSLLARKHHKPIIVVTGSVDESFRNLSTRVFNLILPIVNKPMDLESAMKDSPVLLEQTGERIGDILNLIEDIT